MVLFLALQLLLLLASAGAGQSRDSALTSPTLPVSQIAYSHECERSSHGCLGTPNAVKTSAGTPLATHDHYTLHPYM